MATNGQLKTNTTYESYFWVEWSQKGDQDVVNNRTQIAWSCGVYCGHEFKNNAIKMNAVVINGTQVYSGAKYSNFAKGNHTIASGTMWINHNADGTKSFSISSFTGWLYENHNYSSNGGSFELTTIPRKATITSAPDFTDLDNPTITFNNPGGFSMDVWLEPNPVGKHYCVRENIPNTGSYQWILTNEERDSLRNACAGKKCPIRLGIYSNVGGTLSDDYVDKTFTIVESNATKPSVNMSVTLDNGSLPNKFDSTYIQGKSKLNIALSAKGKYGADITGYYAEIDGKRYDGDAFTTDIIQSSGTVDIVGYAKDSREFTGLTKQQINVTPYSKPLVIPIGSENSILCYRSDGNGKRTGKSTSVWIKAKRSFYSVDEKNQCALQWRRKLSTEAWNDSVHTWSNLLTKEATANEYNALIPNTVFELKKSYTVQIRAIDDVGEHDTKTFEIPTEDVALHLGKGGKNVSIGSYCDYSEEHTFFSEWKAIFDNGVQIGEHLIADFPIEAGTDATGMWTYEKRASGIAECWCEFSASTPVEWDDKQVKAKVSLPFTFAGHPVVNCSGGQLGNSASHIMYAESTNTYVEAYARCVETPSDDAPCIFYFQVKGKWK